MTFSSYKFKSDYFFSVIDIPSLPYLNTLKNSKTFSRFKCKGEEASPKEKIDVIVHFSPQSIIQHEDYQTWMKSFPKETTHLIMNESNKCDGYAGQEDIQSALRMVSEDFFPRLNSDSLISKEELNKIYNHKNVNFDNHSTDLLEVGQEINIYPTFTNLIFDITYEKKFNT